MTKTTVVELKSMWSTGFVSLFHATLNTVVTGVAVAAEYSVLAADAAIKVVGEQSTKLGVVCAEHLVVKPAVETPVQKSFFVASAADQDDLPTEDYMAALDGYRA